MKLVDVYYIRQLYSTCTIGDLESEEDLISVFEVGFDYIKEKSFFSWKIKDIENYKRKEEECIERYNTFLKELDKSKIEYKTQKDDRSFKDRYGIEQQVLTTRKATVYISKVRKWWYFELTRKWGYELQLKSLKKVAGTWYERIKDTKPAIDMIADSEQLIQEAINVAYEGHRDNFILWSEFEDWRVLLRDTHGYERYEITFRKYGYEDMNIFQRAALMAIYLEATYKYCSKQAKLSCVEYDVPGWWEDSSSMLHICSKLYLEETKPLKAW